MAKLTKSALESLVVTQVAAAKQANPTFTSTTEAITGLVNKIGMQVTFDSDFTDFLPFIDAGDIPYGESIEEWFMNLTLPQNYDGDGANVNAPNRPTFAQIAYNYLLDRKTIKTTEDNTKLQKAMLGQPEHARLLAMVLKRLTDSKAMHDRFIKKQLLGNLISKAVPTGTTLGSGLPDSTMTTVLAEPVDTATGEAFTKAVKQKVTSLGKFVTESNNLNGSLAKAERLVLLVKGEKILPTIDVDVISGAFHKDRAEIPVDVYEVEDFGTLTANKNAYAVLMDDRVLKLYWQNRNSESQRNGEGEFTNFWIHATPLGLISRNVNYHVFVSALDK